MCPLAVQLGPYSWCTSGALNPQPLVLARPDDLLLYFAAPSSLPRVGEQGITFVAANGLYATFQFFSEPKLSSLLQHPRCLLLPLALNRLQDAEEYLPAIALPAHTTILSLSFLRIPSITAAYSSSAASIAHTEEPVVFTTSPTLLLVIVFSP